MTDVATEIKQEAPGIKLEAPDGTSSDVEVEAHFDEHLAVKREEECSEFGCPATFIKSESRSSENSCDLTEEKVETESDSEVEGDHKEAKANEKRFKCDKCAYQTDIPASLRRHASSHSNKKLLNCPHCNYKGRQQAYLLLHLTRVHPDKLPHVCESCSFRSFDLSGLEKHREKHKQEAMKCEFCNDFVTTDLIQMQSHKRRVHRRKCPNCDYRCLSSDKLRQHMLMHESETTLSCVNCRYKTRFQYNLERHIARKHMVERADCRKYKCPHCTLTTNQLFDYKLHLFRHTGERPFSCDQCDFKTVRKDCLKRHVLLKHSNERPFKCEFCQKGYVQQSDLQTHLLVHSKKLLRCGKCNYLTPYKKSLEIHKQLERC